MLTLIEIGIMRIFEVLFFVGIAGCVVTIAMSWYLIFKEELKGRDPSELPPRASQGTAR
jgi:hypothetical protein